MQISFTINIKLRVQYEIVPWCWTAGCSDGLWNPGKEPEMAEKVLPKFETKQRDNREFTKKHRSSEKVQTLYISKKGYSDVENSVMFI